MPLPGQVAAVRAQEAYPRSRIGRFEVDGLDFRPEGPGARVRSGCDPTGLGLLGLRALSVLNGRGAMTRVAGYLFRSVVPITFNNTAPPFPAAQYQNVLFSPSPSAEPYSVRSYYQEMSRGSVTISGVVLDWVVADSADVYYEDGCNGVGVKVSCPHGGRPFVNLLLEALKANDTGALDWGQFDNDGPDGLPNSGDDDGVVDFVTFLQPKVDGACGAPGIWAHRYFMSAWNGSPYTTKSPRRGAGGAILPGQFIKVDDYHHAERGWRGHRVQRIRHHAGGNGGPRNRACLRTSRSLRHRPAQPVGNPGNRRMGNHGER